MCVQTQNIHAIHCGNVLMSIFPKQLFRNFTFHFICGQFGYVVSDDIFMYLLCINPATVNRLIPYGIR
jgi:hypothetical protein